MKLREIFVKGFLTTVPILVAGWMIYGIAKIALSTTGWIFSHLSTQMPQWIQWLIAIGFLFTFFIVMGWIAKHFHPFTKIAKRLPLLKHVYKEQNYLSDSNCPVVSVKIGDLLLIALKVNEIHLGQELYYLLAIISSPMPISGYLILALPEAVKHTNLSYADLAVMTTSFGFRLPDNKELRHWPIISHE